MLVALTHLKNTCRQKNIIPMNEITSVSFQLIGRKSNLIFSQLYYLMEGTVAFIQRVDNIEQCSDI